jgi:hypothetical protein
MQNQMADSQEETRKDLAELEQADAAANLCSSAAMSLIKG